MADNIEKVTVPNGAEESFAARWGSVVCDYKLNGVTVDLQDLLVAVSEHRATAVEGEVSPLATRMRRRNSRLDQLGTVLAELTKGQSSFDSEATGTTKCDAFTQATVKVLDEFCAELGIGKNSEDYRMKKNVDAFAEKVKNAIDTLNNVSQNDMTRMQGLVDRRDEAYSTATNLMKSVSETRDNVIRNY